MRAGRLAVVVGDGNVGLGVMLRRLQSAGYEVAVITHRPASATRLRRQGVLVQSTAPGELPRRERADVVASASDVGAVRRLVLSCSLVVIAVRPPQQHEAALAVLEGLTQRRDPVNVLVCDNRPRAGEIFRNLVRRIGGPAVADRHGFVSTLVDQIASTVSARTDAVDAPSGSTTRAATEPRVEAVPERRINVEPVGWLYLDAGELKAAPPHLPGAVPVEDHAAYVRRKLFVFSAGHLAAAVLGRMGGHLLVGEAVADPQIRQVTLSAMAESRAGLEHLYGPRFAGPEEALPAVLGRFADPNLRDAVARVAQELPRKLEANERVCGPARLSLSAGHRVPALTMVAAASLYLSDQDSQGPRRPDPAPHVAAGRLCRLSGMPRAHPFVQQVAEVHEVLVREGFRAVAEALSAPAHCTTPRPGKPAAAPHAAPPTPRRPGAGRPLRKPA